MKLDLSFGHRSFVVDIAFGNRKYLSITVHPDLRITAKAPAGYDSEIIHNHLKKRASWIAKQLNYFEQLQPLPTERKFVSGETHYYLGRQYRLRIRKGKPARVRLMGRFFEMELADTNDRKKAKKLMLDWYSKHAKELLLRRLGQYAPIFERMGAFVQEVRFRRMKKRWGSCCSEAGIIILNTELVKAPIHCIDYVLIHELCHLICPHHDKKFYHLLGRILPDWEKRKERLEKVVI